MAAVQTLAFALAICGMPGRNAAQAPADPNPSAPAPEAPPSPADLHPLKLADGQTTSNDRCPVRKRKLNPQIEPVYVNQHPVGFC